LSQYGENYELIAYVLPGRDRKACKNKFKAEDKKNPARISFCLDNRIPVGKGNCLSFIEFLHDISFSDISTLSRMTGKDFSGPVPEIRAPQLRPVCASGGRPVEHFQDASLNLNEGTSEQIWKRNCSDAIVIGDIDSHVDPSS
jgi:transcription factor TFIIIB component B''